MPFHFTYSATLFTPQEAERITGLPRDMQRDWRRRGLLPANKDGHARFDVVALATMMFMKLMTDRGIGPQLTKDVAEIAGPAIAYSALHMDGTIEGDLPPSNAPLAALRMIAPGNTVSRGAIPGPCFIWWADGTEFWHKSLEAAIADLSDAELAPKLAGPVIVLDQRMIGAVLVSRAGRPLVVSERVDDDEPVRPKKKVRRPAD